MTNGQFKKGMLLLVLGTATGLSFLLFTVLVAVVVLSSSNTFCDDEDGLKLVKSANDSVFCC